MLRSPLLFLYSLRDGHAASVIIVASEGLGRKKGVRYIGNTGQQDFRQRIKEWMQESTGRRVRSAIRATDARSV